MDSGKPIQGDRAAGLPYHSLVVANATIKVPMPSYVLICESCGNHEPFNVYEEELGEIQSGKPVVRQCPVCRAKTNWESGFPERRSGRERRQGEDRRG